MAGCNYGLCTGVSVFEVICPTVEICNLDQKFGSVLASQRNYGDITTQKQKQKHLKASGQNLKLEKKKPHRLKERAQVTGNDVSKRAGGAPSLKGKGLL